MFCLRNHDWHSFLPSFPSQHKRIWKHCMTDSSYLCLQDSPSERYEVTRSAVLPHSLPGDMITTLLRVSSWRRQPSCSQLSISENAIAIYRTCGEQRTPLPNAGDAGQVLPVFMIRSDSSTTCTDPRAGSGSWHTLPSPFLPACCVKTREEHTQGGPAAPWSTCFLTSSLRRGGREEGRCSEILPIT